MKSRPRKSDYVAGSMAVPVPRRDGRSRFVLSIILLLVASMFMGSAMIMASTPHEAYSMSFVKRVICTLGWKEPGDVKDGEYDEDAESNNALRPAVIYQLTDTDDLQKTLFFKSTAGADADNVEKDWFNVLSGKDYKTPTLDILNNKNGTKKKYTPYDLYGFSGLKWSNYMGEWNWIKVYYCGADGHGGDDKNPEDQKINMYYDGRNRPLDTWESIPSSRDPRVQMSMGKTDAFPQAANSIANFFFGLTKGVVAFNNMLFTKSMSNIVGEFKLNELTQKIMMRLFNNLFMGLVVMMIALMAASIMYTALIRKEFRKAMTTVVKSLVIVFMGYLMMAAPKFFVNLPNYAGMLAQYLTISITQSVVADGNGIDICSTSTNGTVKGDSQKAPAPIKNGKLNVDGMTKWLDDLGQDVSRKTTCKYWEMFAVTPWSLGQYGTTINNLWAKGKAPSSSWLGENHEIGYHADSKKTSESPEYPGLAAVPLGNNQVMNNWAIYQISTQTTAHIPGDIADPKTGAISEEPNPKYTELGQLETRNRRIDDTNGDWWRVVDVVSGYDTKGRESGGSGSSSSSGGGTQIDKAVKWALGIANDDTHGYSQRNRTGNPDYDCSSLVSFALKQAGFNVAAPFSTANEVQELEKAGFKKVNNPNFKTGEGLKPGDVLWWNGAGNGGHTEFYIGNGKTVGAHHDENGGVIGAESGDQDGTEISIGPLTGTDWAARGGAAYRYGSGSDETYSTSSEYNEQTGNSSDVYSPKANTSVTDWWSTWVGGAAWNRLWIALMSLVCCLALIAPVMLGVTILTAAIMSVVLMMFAPVVMILSLVPNIGNSLLTKWGGMLWGTVVKRGVLGMVYMILMVVTSNIMQNVIGLGNYLKSALLVALLGFGFLKFKDTIVHLIMSKVNVGGETAVSGRMSKVTKSAGKITKAASLGAVKGIHKTIHGETVRDAAGNKNGKDYKRYTKNVKHGKHKGEIREVGRLGTLGRNILAEAGSAAKGQFGMEMEQTRFGRVMNNHMKRTLEGQDERREEEAKIGTGKLAKDRVETCSCNAHDDGLCAYPRNAVPYDEGARMQNNPVLPPDVRGNWVCNSCIHDHSWDDYVE